MSIESGITFLIALFIFAITPGPGTFALVGRALASGWSSCVGMAVGMTISDIIYLVLACFGLAVIAERWTELFTLIRFAGAAYLLYLGWKMWFTPVVINEENCEVRARGWHLGILQGFLISASNPKVILFYIAFLPTFIDLSLLGGKDIVIVSLLAILGLMAGLLLVSYCAGSARNYFRSKSALTKLNRTAGGVMASAGVYLAING